MGRYTGPVEKLSRREGVELFLKGERALNGKSALERRGDAPPGQHGQARRKKPSIYQTQLRAKQTAKRYYGIREGQFRRYVQKANRMHGVTGEELLNLLERRLDNVVYRLGFAGTRAQARQFVNHGHVRVDGKKVDIASFLVKEGQTIAIHGPVREVAAASTELTGVVSGWLQTDFEALEGKVLRLPVRSDINAPVNEQLIVELYSRL
ncbi:30S ribosomal protein S4 [Solirubrobacter ginsenosidimutans]|uniref:Small ribosomal subunit protein uS4 n=1 Tax=Solirubrobacter ginsenosidimutans TaxID=490573 RepID=A0A9X3S541_9ACTN|nr:30S ribosomal protein S4 [Solirubrobacter ginsenosidimutans]MDA0163786.1 30S ribosomal protein S4 [Solirubrobacter ginsenosidimutans]